MPRETSPTSSASSDRLVSLDAFRGFTMFLMVSAGLALADVAKLNETWKPIADQTKHCEWVGCTLWDLIQPAFMFVVGVSMVFSYANRLGKGQNYPRQVLHAVKRAALLCLIGFFLDTYSGGGIIFIQFTRVLQQIAIGYVIAFAVLPLGPRVQAVTAILLLVGHTAAYKLYEPGTLPPPPDVRHAETNAEAKAATALDPVWRPNDNFGRQLDARLHLPPTSGYYVTFNAISSAATILFGILVGELLRSAASPTRKIYVLLGAGLCGLAFGWAISGGGGWIPFEFTPIVPLVKKIWTASFAIFSAGWTCLGMALFYAVIDVAGWKAWAFPFVVVGMNSIAMYVLSGTMRSNFRIVANMFVPIAPIPDRPGPRLCDYMPVVDLSTWQWHFGVDLTGWYLTPFVGSSIVMLCFWLCTYAMYRNKIFLKV